MSLTATDKQKIAQSTAATPTQYSPTTTFNPDLLSILPNGPINEKLVFLYHEMSLRFEPAYKLTDKPLTEMREYSDRHFEQIERRFKTIYWILGIMITIGSALRFLLPICSPASCRRFNGERWAFTVKPLPFLIHYVSLK